MTEEFTITPSETDIIDDVVVNDLPGFPPEFYEEALDSEVLLAESNIPEDKHLYNNTDILDQGREGACTVFWITKVSNEENYYDKKTITDALAKWKEYIDKWLVPNKWEHWWSLYGAMSNFKADGIIEWWYLAHTPQDVYNALALKRCVYTWTNQCDWGKTRETGVFTPVTGTRTWHAFAIVGIDMKARQYIAANSWSKAWGEEGLFRINFDDTKYLYTRSVIIDKIDGSTEDLADLRHSEEMKKAKIWNGKTPNDNLKKMHAVLMVMRAIKKEFNDTKALTDAQRLDIATSINMNDCTREELATMLIRAVAPKLSEWGKNIQKLAQMKVVKSTNGQYEPVTRYHAILIIARFLDVLNTAGWQLS